LLTGPLPGIVSFGFFLNNCHDKAMKHLIIPTDFSLRSLEPVRAAVLHFDGEPIVVTLLHLVEPPADIMDGLRMAYRADVKPEVPRVFTLALESLQAVYARQLLGVKVGIWHGSTALYLRNLVEHLGADASVFDSRHPFEAPTKVSIDPRPLLRRAMKKGTVVDVSALQASASKTERAERDAQTSGRHAALESAQH